MDTPNDLLQKAKMMCWEYNQTSPAEGGEGIGTSAPITIGDDVWIGANATVCPGVTIGNGTIIGAGSVVNKDIPAGVIAAGSPCKVLREVTEDKVEVMRG